MIGDAPRPRARLGWALLIIAAIGAIATAFFLIANGIEYRLVGQDADPGYTPAWIWYGGLVSLALTVLSAVVGAIVLLVEGAAGPRSPHPHTHR